LVGKLWSCKRSVTGGARAKPTADVFQSQRLDLDEDRRRRDESRQRRTLTVLDPAHVRGQADRGALVVLDRALGLRIEGAQALDLVVEELDPQRAFGGEGEDVEHVAAQADLAWGLDERLAFVSRSDQPGELVLRLEFLTHLQVQELPLELGGIRQWLEGGELRAVPHCVGVDFTASRGARWEQERVESEGLQVGGEGLGLALGRGDGQPGALDARFECRQEQRLGGAPEVSGGRTPARPESVDQVAESRIVRERVREVLDAQLSGSWSITSRAS
jgi:hypothetical protein